MRNLKIGVIGAGGIGQVHIERFSKLEGAEVAAIADPNKIKLSDVAGRYGIASQYDDWEKMLKEADIDAVVICSPNVFHAGQSIKALKAGKHVLCEKPIALSSQDIRKVLSVAQQKRRIFMGAMCWRFNPASTALKCYVESGKSGDIYYSRATLTRRRGIPGLGGWFTNKKLAGGGTMFDLGVHMLDLMIWIMGNPQPTVVSAATYQRFKGRSEDGGWPPKQTRIGDKFDGIFDVDDFAAGFVHFKNGASLVLETCWACNNEPTLELKFYGDLAGAKMSGNELTIFGEDESGFLVDVKPQLNPDDQYLLEARHFADCIRTGKEPITKHEEMLNVVSILEAFYKSSERGKGVAIAGKK